MDMELRFIKHLFYFLFLCENSSFLHLLPKELWALGSGPSGSLHTLLTGIKDLTGSVPQMIERQVTPVFTVTSSRGVK